SIVVEKIERLKGSEFVVSFADLAADFMGWRTLLRAFMAALSPKGESADFHVICAEDSGWIEEARRRNMDFGPFVQVYNHEDEMATEGVLTDVA
ncbi:MAG: hypothetical protein Q7S00_05620, partial [bacterium]|nr:hypothetical protein [bacterium]